MPIRAALSIVAALAGLAAALPVRAAPCTAQSSPQRAALVELYTSEGCSSCPPAERWLSTLSPGRHAGAEIVPLALHVGYWDYIGWKDPYARPEFAGRQRRIAALQHATFVYTPQVVLQGRDFRGWGSGAFSRAVAQINAQPAAAAISLALGPLREGGLEVEAGARVLERGHAEGAGLYLAAYQSRLVSRVRAGENEGRTLRHDFVVRSWTGPIAFGPDGRLRATRRLALPPGAGADNWGVAAFVQDRASGEVLQALQLPACPG
jgi:hypothetical protein